MESSSDEDNGVQVSRYTLWRRRKRRRTGVDSVSNEPSHISEESEEQDSPDTTPQREQRPGIEGHDERSSASSGEINDPGSSDDPTAEGMPYQDIGVQGGEHVERTCASSDENDTESSDHLNLEGIPDQDVQDEGDQDQQPANSDEDEMGGMEVLSATSQEDMSDVSEDREEQEDDLLYPGGSLTVRESLMMIFSLASKHNLTGKCISDILSLISVHCIPNNKCLTSLYKYKKYFSMLGKEALVFHYFCTGCVYPLESKESICPTCNGAQGTSFFIELPIRDQMQAMLRRPGFFEALQYRFNRVKKDPRNIEDIYDGEMYASQFNNHGFLRNPNNISFGWYSDGVSIYNSSNFQIWPLYFTINELRQCDRSLKENIVLAGIWFGSTKPNPNVFLRPIHLRMAEFCNQGYGMELAGGEKIHMKGMILHGVADLPAKCTFLKFKQWNGNYGCVNCMIKGERFVLNPATGSSIQVYPYNDVIRLRNNADVQQYATEAVELRLRDPKASVFGVKGPSILYSMVPNMVRCTGIDRMHAADYGVGKQVLGLWFDPSHSNEPFSISGLVAIVNARLKNIKPPSFVERMPRSIPTPSTSQWKSQEYKHWIFYYSIPVLLGIIDLNQLSHHCLLVSGLFLLSQRSISSEHVHAASELLHKYVSEFQNVYGLRHMGINVHQLLHLSQVVRDLGPLWVYSCYYYEDLNGKLANLIHGTKHAGMQVCSAASAYLNLRAMVNELPQGAARSFCERLQIRGECLKIADQIAPGEYVVGTYSTVSNDADNNTSILLQGLGIDGGCRRYFYRVKKKGVVYYCSSYQRSIQKESSYSQFLHNNDPHLGRLNYFVKWSNCGPDCNDGCILCQPEYFAVATVYERVPWFVHNIPNVRLPYLNQVLPTDHSVIFPIKSLECLCYFLEVEGNMYIASPVSDLLEAD